MSHLVTQRLAALGATAAGGLLLIALAVANAAGYRFGVADQAFYLPSILEAADPALYPRDDQLIDAQGRLMVNDEIAAWLVTHSGIEIETLFLASHLASLALLFLAVWLLGRRFARHRWTAVAGCLAVTLRHRIIETGANTFEGYYHPRGLAFACGVAAAAALARERLGAACALVALAMVLHPTTGLWWAVWLSTAALVLLPRYRARLAAAGTVAGLAAVAALWLTPLSGSLRVMDAAWVRPFAAKDYVFPTAWPASAWLVNLLLPVVIVGVVAWRRRIGIAARWETGMAAGTVALTALFLASLPLIAGRLALAVQLQTSRIFWVLDLFAVLAVTWLAAEGGRRATAAPGRSGGSPTAMAGWRPAAVAVTLLVASAARGTYIMLVEHPERPFVQARLEDTAWVRIGGWIAARTPVDTYVLADPDHDWKFGHSMRLTARRDVLVEGVKDAAVSLYDRDVATRVQARIDAIGDFSDLDAVEARDLARRFDLDVLVIDRDLPLRELHRDGRFRIYELEP